jgi:hypothetical protein
LVEHERGRSALEPASGDGRFHTTQSGRLDAGRISHLHSMNTHGTDKINDY